jgi:xylulokinase
MKKPLILGLDVGTTNVKAAAFAADGQVIAAASQEYLTSYPRPGWAEQRPADWQTAIVAALKRVLAELGSHRDRVHALGLSAHAPGLVPVDSQGTPLLEWIPTWQDERSIDQGSRLLEEVGPEWVGLGMPMAAFAAKLKWFVERHHGLTRETRWALGVKAYLAGWLTGRWVTDPSSEPGQLPDWQRTVRACGWSLDKLPPVLPATEVVGELREELSRELRLRHQVPVVMGLNDGASASLGNGALRPGEAVVTLATNGVVFLVTQAPIPAQDRLDQALFCWPYVGGRWIVGGQTKAGAGCLQWLHELLQGDPAESGGIDRLLLECAEQTPGSAGVSFYPYLMGRGTPEDDPAARGAFLGLTMSTMRKDLTQAVLEGVAFALREIVGTLAQKELIADKIILTGGGARSPIWRQIIADVLAKPLSFSEGDSCLGAAMIASVGAGLHPDIRSAVAIMQHDPHLVQPRPGAAERYKRIYQEYVLRRDHVYASV